ncbi:TPA: hypothetical protein N0F65_010722 [Lagenidium giganteum]|uniref:FYVE-type domain-containing protein n=1 Tax=Lagenidium giganteum TaxID=4803 RepID=A0AAV2YKL4_9STRA|nr:TPA: hypothetical protein N0F65_010722 [Lagenidium giganteum]
MGKNSPPAWSKFRCPPLTASRREQIKNEANVACDELLRFSAGELLACPEEDELRLAASLGDSHHSMHSLGSVPPPPGLDWEYADQIESIRVEKIKVRSENKKAIYYFRGITQMEASIDEIMELYQVDAEQPNVQLEKKLTPDLLHSMLLYEIKPYDFQDQTVFIGIRWSAVRSPYVLVRNRDYCYLECQRRFSLADGRRGFVRCLHSVKIKCCPDLEKSHGFVRASMYRSGLVFVESRRDRRTLDVVQAVYTDLKGSVPQFVASMGIRNTILNLEHLKKYVNMKRVANQSFVRHSQLMSRGKVRTCFVCVDDIGTFKRRYNCQKCGEVICGRCKLTINAEIPVVGKMKLTICSLCSLAINRSVLTDPAGNDGQGSASLSRALGERPYSASPLYKNSSLADDRFNRKRAFSMNSFHTACLDQTTIYGSILTTTNEV